jgi:hypothetical protein
MAIYTITMSVRGGGMRRRRRRIYLYSMIL